MKHLLTLKDLEASEITDIIELAMKIKGTPERYTDKLNGKTLALLFQKTSTRTRLSFESGMIQLGGHAVFLDWRTTNITLGQLSDEIQCMARYVDAIMGRVYEHSDLELMSNVSRVPIINGLSDGFHPCQALADLMQIYEHYQDPANLVVSFVGDGSNNVATSLVIACAKLGITTVVGAPSNFSLRDDVKKYLAIKNLNHLVRQTTNPYDAVKDADVIYTDTWVSMGQEEEKQRRLKIFGEYQVNKNLVDHSSKNPIVMHCLPAHRDYEITSEVLDSKQSVVFDQAENRLHTQKALLLKLMCSEFADCQNTLF